MTTQELKQYIDKVLGNSIRCLLPSYWWKRLFSLTLEKVDEKLDATNIKTINGESIVGEGNLKVGVTTVGSIDELNALEASVGDIATVGEESAMLVRAGDLPQVNVPSEILGKWDNLTRIVKVEFGEPVTENGRQAIVYLNGKKPYNYDTIHISSSEGGFFCAHIVAGEIKEITIEEVNERLKKHDYRFMMGSNGYGIDRAFKLHAYSASANAYIKGDSWERLAKESDLGGNEGGNGEDKTLTFYAPIDDVSLSDAEKQHNAESYQKVAEGFETDKYYDVKVLMSTSQLVALDVIKTINPAIDNGRLKLTFGGVGSGIDLQMLTVTSDGSATITIEGIEESGVELRDLYIYENYDGTLTELTEEQKAWNVETLELAKQGKAIVRITLHGNTFILELFNEDNDYQFGYTQFSPSGGVAISVGVTEDGLSGIKIEESHFDSELSTTSINAVQNKVIAEAINAKVDKVEGKQLSTEDFTSALKAKLEGLNAFDPTEINNKVDGLQTQLNNLVSGDASTAIESFNEITAFLNGVTDSETLDGIIAGIEQQIAAKQEQLVSGETIKTINGQSLLGEGDIEIKANIDTTTLATKEELATLQNEVIANEEVTAAALNDLNVRINDILTRLNNAGI